MSSKNRYFLVARNRKDNKFKFLKMDDNFCEINHFPKDRKANELEIIDLYTSFFKNREEFINYLMLTSQIDSFDTDVFITYQSHKKDHMHFYEVIYNPYNNLRMQDFKTLARKSYEVGLNVHQRESENIINKFCSKMASDKSFRDVVLLDMTNVYKKFVEYFKEFTFSDRPVYSIKYREGGWALESYSLIRNIIEILNRCEMLGEKDKHLVDANIDFLNENINGRLNNSEMLIHKTDKNFFEGQISMFDYLEDKAASLEKEIFEDKEVEEVKEFPQMEPKKLILKRL